MFIIYINFTKPLDQVEPIVSAHRAFLETGYQQNLFVASGPLIPRTGGVIISHEKDRQKLETFLENDPYKINHVAEYDIKEFTPVKFHEKFSYFLE